MPIPRAQFEKGRLPRAGDESILQFLGEHPDQAFTVEEVVVGAHFYSPDFPKGGKGLRGKEFSRWQFEVLFPVRMWLEFHVLRGASNPDPSTSVAAR